MGHLGRPREIDRQVTVTRNDGTQRTATKGDLFIEELARGTSQKVAAALAGLGESTVVESIARGEGTDPRRDQDDANAAFAVRVREAKARGQATHERTILLASVPRPVTTRKTGYREVLKPDGQVVRLALDETTVREEYDWRASAWALQHQYGVQAPTQVELSGPDGGPLRAEILAGEFRAFLAGRDEALDESVIDVAALPEPDVS